MENFPKMQETKFKPWFTMVSNMNTKNQCFLVMNFVKHNDDQHEINKKLFECELDEKTSNQWNHKENVERIMTFERSNMTWKKRNWVWGAYKL
jgi:hypothetical protein